MVQSTSVGAWEVLAPFSWHSPTGARDKTLLLQRTPKRHSKKMRRIRTSQQRTEPRTRRDALTKNAQCEETLNAHDSCEYRQHTTAFRSFHRDTVEGTSNKTHQRALAATEISNDREENHASQLGISYRLIGQGLVRTQHNFVETPTFYANSEKGLIIEPKL